MNQLNDINTNEELKFKLEYLSEINKEYIGKLRELRELNNQNRHILKIIQRNISVEFNTGAKCVVIDNSSRISQNFCYPTKAQSSIQLREQKYQKMNDSEAILQTVLNSIKLLKLRQIADGV